MTRPLVYLCGQITGVPFEYAQMGWRAVVAHELRDANIDVLSPMRGKSPTDYTYDERHAMSRMGTSNPDALSCGKGVTRRDRFDTQRSDLIFCNLLHLERVSIGSMIEFGWADAWRIPIVCVMRESDIHWHAMTVDIASFIVPSLQEGIDITKRILKPGL